MADQVQGLSDFVASTAALNLRLADALPGIVLQAATLVEAEIGLRAPVDTGALRASLDAVASRRASAASATVQVDNSAQGGLAHYAIFQEYGTSRMPARPFFRPGIEAARPKVDALMTSALQKVIAA